MSGQRQWLFQRHSYSETEPDLHGNLSWPRITLVTAFLISCIVGTISFHDTAAPSMWFPKVHPTLSRVRALQRPPYPTQLKALHVDDSMSVPTDNGFKPMVPEQAYQEVESLMAHYAKTFYLGSKFFPLEKRKAIWAVYVWCRRTDEIVDGPTVSKDPEKLLADLKAWERRLDGVFAGKPLDALDYTLAESLKVFPGKKEPYYDMIEGMRMDLPVVGQNRYQTWDDLYLYCYRVASTVGLMTLPVMGVSKGYSFQQAEPPAIALGIALQITNILRDVGEDFRERGRIYLPLDDMMRFGVTEDQIKAGIVDDNYRNLMRFEIQRARDYYSLAQTGIPMLSFEARMPVQSSLDLYSQILDSIEKNDFDNFNKRAYVTTVSKLLTLPLSWLRTFGLKI